MIPAHIQSSLFYYGLTIIKRENNMYCLVDLQTGEWYEKMTIYYIQKLLDEWNEKKNQYFLFFFMIKIKSIVQ